MMDIRDFVWIMPMGGTKDQQADVETIVVEAVKKGYKVSARVHVYIFQNKVGR